MFVSIRTYTGIAQTDEVLRRGRQGLLPILRAQQGYHAYFFFRCDDGAARGVSIFDTEAQSDVAYSAARDWVARDLKGLVPNPPTIVNGEVTQQQTTPKRVAEGDHAMELTFTGVAPPARALPAVREKVVPAIMASPGLRGFYSFRDDADEGRMIAAVFCATRQDADAVRDLTWQLAQEHVPDLYPNRPTATGGEVLVADMVSGVA